MVGDSRSYLDRGVPVRKVPSLQGIRPRKTAKTAKTARSVVDLFAARGGWCVLLALLRLELRIICNIFIFTLRVSVKGCLAKGTCQGHFL